MLYGLIAFSIFVTNHAGNFHCFPRPSEEIDVYVNNRNGPINNVGNNGLENHDLISNESNNGSINNVESNDLINNDEINDSVNNVESTALENNDLINNEENNVSINSVESNDLINNDEINEPVNNVDSNRDNDCPICLSPMVVNNNVLSTLCHHSFHRVCLMNWVLTNQTCPLCRTYLAHPRSRVQHPQFTLSERNFENGKIRTTIEINQRGNELRLYLIEEHDAYEYFNAGSPNYPSMATISRYDAYTRRKDYIIDYSNLNLHNEIVLDEYRDIYISKNSSGIIIYKMKETFICYIKYKKTFKRNY